jgi:hypothetical protein
MTQWFDSAGEHTETVIDVVAERLGAGGIRHVVVATTSGKTGARFAEVLRDRDVDVVCVTHHVGFKGDDEAQLEPEHAEAIRAAGGKILTTSHALSGVGRSISKGFGGATPVELIAHTLRLFGQGMKVCVEIAVMAADAGLIPTDRDVICVGGSGGDADTAVVLKPAHANAFFDLRIRETLCRPIA